MQRLSVARLDVLAGARSPGPIVRGTRGGQCQTRFNRLIRYFLRIRYVFLMRCQPENRKNGERKMRRILITAMILSMSASAATADDARAPITYHVPGVTVVVQKHDKSIPLKIDSITWLHRAFTYDCKAASCLVIATTEVQTPGDYGPVDNLCVYADGRPMKPACDIQSAGYEIHNLQEKLILQGAHAFRTGIHYGSDRKSVVCPCIIAYSIYDSGN